ncbi:hypothetical protein OPV22_017679 [Ensete ventricosum]|uniref:PH domain-containing protein n=1 Tax=Ensete ventricosum TaxID=4639 RepID=A0AAV8QYG8_ENSVE|nr:hypothetical protein OPV22_017679 [Ensete ventricosum]
MWSSYLDRAGCPPYPLRNGPVERDVERAITTLKKGAYLLNYGRRGKPKFCPFILSNDESLLICGLTAIFQRYPRPDKEYQSFSLIYNERSLDLICKDKDEAEAWFVGLKALISLGNYRKLRSESKGDRTSSDSPTTYIRKISPFTSPFSGSDISHTGAADITNGQGSMADTVRVSLSSAVSSSSHGSNHEDFDALGDVFIWGEGIGDGFLGGGSQRAGLTLTIMIDASLPKALESAVVLDVHNIACGKNHAVLVTKQGEVFSWGEESGGRLGHENDVDVSQPRLVDALGGMNVELVACGEQHTCAVTLSGDLYTWDDGTHGSGQLFTFGDGIFGALGHGDRRSTNILKEVEALEECALFVQLVVEMVIKVGDKGRLRHGDREPRLLPACVASLSDNIFKVACGHNITVALTTSGCVYTMGSTVYGLLGNPQTDGRLRTRVEGKISNHLVEEISCGSYHATVLTSRTEVYTWGKGANGRLGHGDNDDRNAPTLVEALKDKQVKSVVCGASFPAIICLHNLCKACSSIKSTGASLAPNINKLYRVCDECYTKLRKVVGDGKIPQIPMHQNGSANQVPGELADKDSPGPRMQGQFSRLSSVESFKGENRDSRESNNGYPSSSSKFLQVQASSKKIFSTSVPGSRVASRSNSPTSCKPSPLHSLAISRDAAITCLEICDDLNRTNEDLRQEILKLQAQVDELASTVSEETAKGKAAKEVIKSLTSQLKIMADRVPEASLIFHNYGSGYTSDLSKLESIDNTTSNLLPSHLSESNGKCALAEKDLTSNKQRSAEKDLTSNKQRSGWLGRPSSDATNSPYRSAPRAAVFRRCPVTCIVAAAAAAAASCAEMRRGGSALQEVAASQILFTESAKHDRLHVQVRNPL